MSKKEIQQTNTPPEKMAHTVDDSCAILSICRSTLYDLIAAGQLRAFKLRGRTLIPASELKRLVSEVTA